MQNTFNTNSSSNPIVSIKVIGVGGGGCNAVNRMIDSRLKGVQFISINTDKQVLLVNKAPMRLQIGEKLTRGQGAGADPAIGEKAAEESRTILADVLRGTDLVFITAGMGGGTGTGAAPVIASVAKELGIVTVAVVTKPFDFEGKPRREKADKGIAELRKFVDTIVVIPNQKLLNVLPKGVPMAEAYRYADDVLRQGIAGMSDIITKPSIMNLDFADIKRVIKNRGKAHMGIGRAGGENKVIESVKQAVSSPLLETSIEGATGLVIHVKGGIGVSLDDVATAVQLVGGVVSEDCEIIFGNGIDEALGDDMEITIVATGLAETEEEIRRNLEYQRLATIRNQEIKEQVKKESKEKEEDSNFSFETKGVGQKSLFDGFEENFVKQQPEQKEITREEELHQALNRPTKEATFEEAKKEVAASKEEGVGKNLKTSRVEIEEDDIPEFLKRIKNRR
ncbi:MAG: cell division protein FtsZ [Firmicutes bacterium]|nr:cell division protein FtsZ [Bacillota bacterium]